MYFLGPIFFSLSIILQPLDFHYCKGFYNGVNLTHTALVYYQGLYLGFCHVGIFRVHQSSHLNDPQYCHQHSTCLPEPLAGRKALGCLTKT